MSKRSRGRGSGMADSAGRANEEEAIVTARRGRGSIGRGKAPAKSRFGAKAQSQSVKTFGQKLFGASSNMKVRAEQAPALKGRPLTTAALLACELVCVDVDRRGPMYQHATMFGANGLMENLQPWSTADIVSSVPELAFYYSTIRS